MLPANYPVNYGAAEIYGQINCTNPANGNAVDNVQLTLWQRPNPNATGGWQRGAVKNPAGGTTPYTSQSYLVACNAGWQMHTQMTAVVSTPNGSGPEDNNSRNKTCT
jgi:hypothetical protein